MITFNIVTRAAKKIKKLCAYHNGKADRYEALAKYYSVKAQQHRTAANAYMSGASTIALETADLTVFAGNIKVSDLSERIEAAKTRNDDSADKSIARIGDMKMSDAFKMVRMGEDDLLYVHEAKRC